MGRLLTVPVALIAKCDSMQSNDNRVVTVIPNSDFAPLTSFLTSAGTHHLNARVKSHRCPVAHNKKVGPLEAWPIISHIYMSLSNEPPGSHQHCHMTM